MLEVNFASMSNSEAAKIAKGFGMKTYPHERCEACGTSERYSSNGKCVSCNRAKAKKWRIDFSNSDNFIGYLLRRVRIAVYSVRGRESIPRAPKSDKAFWNHFWTGMMTVYALRNALQEITEQDWESDHICPLIAIGPYVHEDGRVEWMQIACGLNVPWNIWVIPLRMNRMKISNFFEAICAPSNPEGKSDTCTHQYFQIGDIQATSHDERVAILAKVDQCMDEFVAIIPKDLK